MGDFELNSPVTGKMTKVFVSNDQKVLPGDQLFEVEQFDDKKLPGHSNSHPLSHQRAQTHSYNPQTAQTQSNKRVHSPQANAFNQPRFESVPNASGQPRAQVGDQEKQREEAEVEKIMNSEYFSQLVGQKKDFNDHIQILTSQNLFNLWQIHQLSQQDWDKLFHSGFTLGIKLALLRIPVDIIDQEQLVEENEHLPTERRFGMPHNYDFSQLGTFGPNF